MIYSIYAESTPNPEVMRFVSNRMIADKSIEVKNIKEAKNISIAEELLKFPFVKSIYLSSNFISVTKESSVEWQGIAMHLRTFITEHLNENGIKNYTEHLSLEKQLNPQSKQNQTELQHKTKFSAEEKEIEAILNQYIKPAVEGDGGAITLNYYKDNVVSVDLKGACSGCPSASNTLKLGVERLLQEKINPNISVIANEK